MEFGATAGVHATVSACATGAEAIGYAIDMIRSGRADVVDRGRHRGGDPPAEHRRPSPPCARCPPATTSRSAPRARSTRTATGSCSARARASSCWSPRSTRWRAARASTRRPPVSATPPTPTTSPSPSRAARASSRRSGACSPTAASTGEDIKHVNAHATSTPAGDVVETRRDRRGASAPHPLVTSTKSMTGHLLGGAGGIESVFTVLALHERIVPRHGQHRRPRRRRRGGRRARRAAQAARRAGSPRSTTRSGSAATTSPWPSPASDKELVIDTCSTRVVSTRSDRGGRRSA